MRTIFRFFQASFVLALFGLVNLGIFSLQPALATHITIVRGQVTDQNSSPLAQVRLELHTPDGTKTTQTQTDASGNYSFAPADGTFATGDQLVLEVQAPSGYNTPSNSPTNFTWDGGTYSGSPVNFQLVNAPKILTGTVTYKDTEAVNLNADVRACPMNSPGVACVGTHVDATGVYTINLRGGVSAWIVDASVNLSDHNTDWLSLEPPATVTFTNDNSQETKTQDFVTEKVDASITGIFLDANGNPLTSNQFRADCNFTRSDGVGTVRKVDTQSKLTRIGLPAGIYQLWCFHSALAGQSFRLSDVVFVLKPDEDKDLGTIQAVSNSSKISGSVELSDGTPVTQRQVTLTRSGTPEFYTADTDEDGNFTFQNLAAGEWQLGITQGQGYVYRLLQAKTVVIEENGDTSSDNILVLEALDKQITGTLKDSDGATLDTFTGAVFSETADGEFFTAPVKEGTYTLFLPSDLKGEEVQLGVSSDVGSDMALTKTHSVTVSDSTTKDLTLKPDSATISGQLTNEKGKKISVGENDVTVVAVDTFGNIENATVDTDGSFALSVPEGEWQLSFQIDAGADITGAPVQDELVTAKANKTTEVNVETQEKDATIQGTVKDNDGEGVPLAPVVVTNLPLLEAAGTFAPEDVVQVTTSADGDGKYSVDIPDGTYVVFTGSTPEVDDLVEPNTKTVTVKKGKEATANFAFTKSSATISGTVKGTDGKAVDGGHIAAFSEDGGFIEDTIDSNGKFSVSVDASDNWNVVATTLDDGDLLMSTVENIDVAKGANQQNITLTDSGIDIPGSSTQTFDADALANVALPNGASIQFSPFAVDDAGTVSVTVEPVIDLSPTLTGTPVSIAYDVTVRNDDDVEVTKLNTPAKITMPYDESVLKEAGVSEENLLPQFFAEEEEVWSNSGMAALVNTETNEVVVYSEHLTKFSINGAATGAKKRTNQNIIVTPSSAGGPNVRIYNETGKLQSQWNAYSSDQRGHFEAASADIDGDGTYEVVVIAGAGLSSQVRVFEQDGTLVDDFYAYDSSYRGGLTFALGDINGNGQDDIIVGPARALPLNVRAYTWAGSKFKLLDWEWFGGKDNKGIAHLTTGDFDGDGDYEIAGTNGGATIHVYDFTAKGFSKLGRGKKNIRFVPFDSNARVNVLAADINGDGDDELITSILAEGSSYVRVFQWDGKKFSFMAAFLPYAKEIKAGVNVAAGDFNGDGRADIAVAPKATAGPNVRIYTWNEKKRFTLLNGGLVFDAGFLGGVHLTFANVDDDSDDELVVAPQSRLKSTVRVYDFVKNKRKLIGAFLAFPESFTSGVHVSK